MGPVRASKFLQQSASGAVDDAREIDYPLGPTEEHITPGHVPWWDRTVGPDWPPRFIRGRCDADDGLIPLPQSPAHHPRRPPPTGPEVTTAVSFQTSSFPALHFGPPMFSLFHSLILSCFRNYVTTLPHNQDRIKRNFNLISGRKRVNSSKLLSWNYDNLIISQFF